MNELLDAVVVTLFTSLSATIICAVVGIPAAVGLALGRFTGRTALLQLLTAMIAVPTVVIGLFVFSSLRRGGPLGALDLLFTRTGIIMGQVLLALPIMIVFTHSAVESVERSAVETARTLGAGRVAVMLTVLHEALPGTLAAVTAAFGRLIGEVGVSMMLGGNIAGYTRTMTTAIALQTSKGDFGLGMKLGFLLLVISLAVNIAMHRLRPSQDL